ncbi:MAG: glucosaminidase domain-containing protein, partial [Chloroflexi bacterium]|nr:glucosaminidase domain-containing protein [Chloroflexota bacterium]
MTPDAFIALMAPRAQSAYARTGWLPSVQVAQLAFESSWGDSVLARVHHNYGGIRFTRAAPAGTVATRDGFASYRSDDAFWADYERVQRLSLYDPIRAAAPGGAPAQVAALAASPYDAGHYGGDGAALLSIIQAHALTRFDPASSRPALPELSAAPAPDGSLVIRPSGPAPDWTAPAV